MNDTPKELEFEIRGLMLDPTNNSPIVILQDLERTTVLPIWIGLFEANAIAIQLEHIQIPRPLTHDLFANVLRTLKAELTRVVVTELRDNTYFATLELKADGRNHVVDSRPSDALALALRAGARIFVADEVVQKSRKYAIGEKQDWTEEELRAWLEGLDPDDLGKYKM